MNIPHILKEGDKVLKFICKLIVGKRKMEMMCREQRKRRQWAMHFKNKCYFG